MGPAVPGVVLTQQQFQNLTKRELLLPNFINIAVQGLLLAFVTAAKDEDYEELWTPQSLPESLRKPVAQYLRSRSRHKFSLNQQDYTVLVQPCAGREGFLVSFETSVQPPMSEL